MQEEGRASRREWTFSARANLDTEEKYLKAGLTPRRGDFVQWRTEMYSVSYQCGVEGKADLCLRREPGVVTRHFLPDQPGESLFL